jgi:hypothetical protein
MTEACILAVWIMMAISPGVFLLCISTETWQKAVTILCLVISLMGFIGLKYTYDKTPPAQVNHLHNYGEEIR